ncbi:MAG TPA: hypothetical protein VGL72_29330 [Bryobacteraceae bacterium]
MAAAETAVHIDAGHPGARVSPALYGLMTEEINYSCEGGLYAELIRNRSIKEDTTNPVHWIPVQENGGAGSIALDPRTPLNDDIATSLKTHHPDGNPEAASRSRQRRFLGNSGPCLHALQGIVLCESGFGFLRTGYARNRQQ